MDKISSQPLLQDMQKMIDMANGLGQNFNNPIVNNENPVVSDFQNIMTEALDKVNATQQQSGLLAKRFEQGDSNVALSDVMIAMQKSSVAFEATVQVRNRLVSAYQEIMNMPI